MTILIGLTGKKFHGKDTAALLIKENCNSNNVSFLSFAEPIKKALSIVHCIPEICFNEPNLKEIPMKELNNKTPREMAQWFGTDIYRNQFDQNIWLTNMSKRIKNCDSDIIIVTDVRFDNEAQIIKDLGGKIILVDASERVSYKTDNHASENGISNEYIDDILYNNTSIKDLKNQINDYFNKIKNEGYN